LSRKTTGSSRDSSEFSLAARVLRGLEPRGSAENWIKTALIELDDHVAQVSATLRVKGIFIRKPIYKPQLGCEMLCDHHETSEIGNARALFEYNSDFDVSYHNAPSGALPVPDHR
jgi:hypothetical protein